MNHRQKILLKYIIDGYLETAQPISSKYLATVGHIDLSTATIRNEMAELEREGFIAQPHTSAGRVPSIKGLRLYVDELIEPQPLTKQEHRHFENIFSEQGIKAIAKECAARCEAACIVVRKNSDFYYTGFSQLFAQPEFMNAERIHAIGNVIDQFETILPELAESLTDTPQVFLGSNNPLGPECAAIFVAMGGKSKSLMGLLSPVRTNYARSIGTLQHMTQYLQS